MRHLVILALSLLLLTSIAGCGNGSSGGDPALASEVKVLRQEVKSLRDRLDADPSARPVAPSGEADARGLAALAQRVATLEMRLEGFADQIERRRASGAAPTTSGAPLDEGTLERIAADLADLRARLMALSIRVGAAEEPDFREK